MRQSNEKKRDFFWLSYSDLMTSLFFVMLVLFILVFSIQNKLIEVDIKVLINKIDSLEKINKALTIENGNLKRINEALTIENDSLKRIINETDSILTAKNGELTAAKIELDRIREIEKTVNNIDGNYFRYDPINKKHILNMTFQFPTGNSEIKRIIPDKRNDLIYAGRAIMNLIRRFPEEENIKYLIVVEGQASNDGWNGNDDLSYHRAQSLVNFWNENNVGLDRLSNCEIVIAGSGVKGTPRDIPDIPPANQRFLITIVPKIGEMKK
jgi:outer membrane protein OmpA-like peptidoglycan-associated protein